MQKTRAQNIEIWPNDAHFVENESFRIFLKILFFGHFWNIFYFFLFWLVRHSFICFVWYCGLVLQFNQYSDHRFVHILRFFKLRCCAPWYWPTVWGASATHIGNESFNYVKKEDFFNLTLSPTGGGVFKTPTLAGIGIAPNCMHTLIWNFFNFWQHLNFTF